jgi:hypothetical protein
MRRDRGVNKLREKRPVSFIDIQFIVRGMIAM